MWVRTELGWAARLEAAVAVTGVPSPSAPPAPGTFRIMLQSSAPAAPRTTSWACTIQTQTAQDIISCGVGTHIFMESTKAPPSSLKTSQQLRLLPCVGTQVPQTDSPSTRADFLEKMQAYWDNPHPGLTVLLQKLFYLPFTVTAFASSSLDKSKWEGKKSTTSFGPQYISSGVIRVTCELSFPHLQIPPVM